MQNSPGTGGVSLQATLSLTGMLLNFTIRTARVAHTAVVEHDGEYADGADSLSLACNKHAMARQTPHRNRDHLQHHRRCRPYLPGNVQVLMGNVHLKVGVQPDCFRKP